MINFPLIRTRRLTVQLKELTLKQSVDLAATPLDQHEAAADAMLARIIGRAEGDNANPALWTVQERAYVVAHYIACTSEGGGNFAIGNGRLLDYLQSDMEAAPDSVDVGQACGDEWHMRQLLGCEAVVMEAVCKGRMDWLTADMAARLFVPGKEEDRPDPLTAPGKFEAWLSERKSVIQAMPESDFEELFAAYERGRTALHHLFWLGFDEAGHVVLPKMEGGGEELAPARFPVASALGRVAQWLGSRPDRERGIP